MKTINKDELVGYIIRKANDKHGVNLYYEEVRTVLDLEIDFLKSKGLIEGGESE